MNAGADYPTFVELERARAQGEAARRAGRPRTSAPWQYGGERDELLAEAFLEGYDRECRRREARR